MVDEGEERRRQQKENQNYRPHGMYIVPRIIKMLESISQPKENNRNQEVDSTLAVFKDSGRS